MSYMSRTLTNLAFPILDFQIGRSGLMQRHFASVN